VTEEVTGVDLVEWMVLQAAGDLPPLGTLQVAPRGASIQVRLYAEDPARNFQPCSGLLTEVSFPQTARVETWVERGSEVPPYYDPMIAKLIVWEQTRDLALSRMFQALAEYRIVGVANNVEFLSRLVASPAFTRGDLDTELIEREHAFLFPEQGQVPREAWLVAALATVLREEEMSRAAAARDADPYSPWHLLDGWRLNSGFERRLIFRHGDQETAVVVGYGRDYYDLTLDGTTTAARGELGPNSTLRVELAGLRLDATVVAAGERRHVFLNGRSYQLARVDPLYHGGEGQGLEGRLVAPMPGRVVAWLAKPGTDVEKNAPLLILEAMKMEHTITAPSDGRVEAFRFAVGEQVTEGAELVDFVKRA